MKTKEIIRENEALRESLTPENKKFYEGLLIEVRGQGLLKDEKAYEETLLAILQDVKAAQDKGISAEAYLGKDPVALAHEIVAEIPRMNWKKYAILPLIFLATSLPKIVLEKIFMPGHTTTIGLLDESLKFVLIVVLAPLIISLASKYRRSKYFVAAAVMLFVVAIFVIIVNAIFLQYVWTIIF